MTLDALVFVLNFSWSSDFLPLIFMCKFLFLIHKCGNNICVHDFRVVNMVVCGGNSILFRLTFCVYASHPILQVQHSIVQTWTLLIPYGTRNSHSHTNTCTITTCIAFTMMLSFRHHQSGLRTLQKFFSTFSRFRSVTFTADC